MVEHLTAECISETILKFLRGNPLTFVFLPRLLHFVFVERKVRAQQ